MELVGDVPAPMHAPGAGWGRCSGLLELPVTIGIPGLPLYPPYMCVEAIS